MPPQNTPLWLPDYLELKARENQQRQNKPTRKLSALPLFAYKGSCKFPFVKPPHFSPSYQEGQHDSKSPKVTLETAPRSLITDLTEHHWSSVSFLYISSPIFWCFQKPQPPFCFSHFTTLLFFVKIVYKPGLTFPMSYLLVTFTHAAHMNKCCSLFSC